MASKQIQLHALPQDVPMFLRTLVETEATVHFFAGEGPGGFVPLLSVEDAEHLSDGLVYIVASLHPIECRGKSWSDILRENPGVLTIIYPFVHQGCVSEIAISATSDAPDDPQMAVWAKFMKRLKRGLVSGAFVQNLGTGDGRYYKDARATENAVVASRSGAVRLTSGNGGIVFTYGSPNLP